MLETTRSCVDAGFVIFEIMPKPGSNTCSKAQVIVTVNMKNIGIAAISRYFIFFIFIKIVEPIASAIAAKSWFATPNIGHIVATFP